MLAELELEAEASQGNEEALTDLERRRLKTEEAQEIGPLPALTNPGRKESCRYDLVKYALTYFKRTCYRGLAPYQREMLLAFQQVVLHGGKKARSVRRGGLKSTIARIATAWAIDYGHRKFVVLVGATDDKSNEHRDNFLALLNSSPEHKADFPEQIPLRLKQLNPKKQIRLDGELLMTSAKDDRGCIVFPCIAGAGCSEARVAPYSMKSTDISGLSFVNAAGEVIRPDLLVFDDVQTPESARSFRVTGQLENKICTTFMGLAGLGETIAAIMACTVREANDLTVRFCSRKLHPDWDGQLFPVLIDEPVDKQNWAIYGQKLREGATPEEGFEIATAHYITHREPMDKGGKVAWEEDKEEGYVSALQWCMTISILQPDYFRCEMQQKGAAPAAGAVQLSAEELVLRLSNVARGIVPAKASYLTAFVDSSDHVLWWMVCGWQKDFSGWIVDYGTWPDQKRQQFYKSDLQRMLEHELPGASWEEAFVNAHNKLDEFLLGRTWGIEGGGAREIDLLLKDWADGGQKRLIESQVMASRFKSRIRPSKGFAPKPGKKPIHLYGDAKLDRHTNSHWVERRTEQPFHIQFDANVFKNSMSRRLRTVVAAPSAMLLPGHDEIELGLLAEHLTSEVAKPLVYDGTPGVVYEEIPGRDNDWWDTLTGCSVGASVLGCCVPGEEIQKEQPKAFTIPAHRRGNR